VTLQVHQARNIPAHTPQLWPREMPPLGAISADGKQHVELCAETAQRRGLRCKEPRDQALFIDGCRRLFRPSRGVTDGTIRVVPALLMCAQRGSDFGASRA
jgi:hypothetical protein